MSPAVTSGSHPGVRIPLTPSSPDPLMALTEEDVRKIMERLPGLAARFQARLETVTDLAEARGIMGEMEAAEWATLPDGAGRLPYLLSQAWMEAELNVKFPPKQEGPSLEDLERESLVIRPEDPEAREWLRTNPGDAPLAANAFDVELARAFVDSLYAAGARRVVIASENILDEDPPYCDALRVQLPDDPAARAAVLALVNVEVVSEGFDPYEDTGQDVVVLWWD